MFVTPSQAKRIAIAQSLITDPSIIVLDEPTSGLDSIQALNIVKMLRRLADETGISVILTIH